MTNMEGEVLKC